MPTRISPMERMTKKKQFILLLTTNFTIMNMEKEMMYEAPLVEVFTVEVEQGFAGSILPPSGDNEGY